MVMVRFCRRHKILVAPRGEGHATFGQAQVKGGLVIETGPLRHIGPVDGDTVTVGAGARWSEVAKSTLRQGLTPPVFTDYLELSVGGTLSVGGLGGQTHQHGAQVDTVTELEVVTGAGELVRCSASRHADLFDAVRAGLGQCAIVVGATLRLVQAPETVRHFQLPYTDLSVFLEDQRKLITDGRFDYVEGLVFPDDTGAFRVTSSKPSRTDRPPAPSRTTTSCWPGCGTRPRAWWRKPSATTPSSTGSRPPSPNRRRPGSGTTRTLAEPAPAVAVGRGIGLRHPGRARPEDIGPTGVVLNYPMRRRSCARRCCGCRTTRCRICSPCCARARPTTPPR